MLAMLADLIAYEAEHLRDGMLITDECRRLTARWPVAGRAVILAAGVVVVGHLADVVPYRYDLLAQKFWAARRLPRTRQSWQPRTRRNQGENITGFHTGTALTCTAAATGVKN